MDNDLMLLSLILLSVYLISALTRPCYRNTDSKERFSPSASPDVEIGTVEVDSNNDKKANDVKFSFRGTFKKAPFIKLEAMSGKNDMTGKDVYSITVKNVTESNCEIRVTRVDKGRYDAPINKKFLIQYIAIEDPTKSSV